MALGQPGTPSHGIGPRWCHADCFVKFIEGQFVEPAKWFNKHLPDNLTDVPGMD